MNNNLISQDYLMHHGVKGMKWGVRHDKKRAEKLERYRNKLSRKANKKAVFGKQTAREWNAEYQDLKKNGKRSEYWTKEMTSRGQSYVEENGALGIAQTYFEATSNVEFNKYKAEVRSNRNAMAAYGKKWANRNTNLMNMKITTNTTKKDIRKVYKGK